MSAASRPQSAGTRSSQDAGKQGKERRPDPKRINVAVTPDTVRALELVMDREGVSLTEAVRRLIGYGEFVYRAVREDGADLLVKTDDSTKEVVLL
ncbi:hypothetical protein F0L68_20570 [Solihabitans fulvus]|uniref:Ribbon-helix-helix protein, copG family n=1 Tax=Solihabitans fulvus TaxID=1892852 RepID=A0A5B2XBF9_9PSEU|nr:hypothetical protein [Solihabitans fulvus]KAA2260122.1 hypothetical protein F0L68_20570 [Solihabitans fulvus]